MKLVKKREKRLKRIQIHVVHVRGMHQNPWDLKSHFQQRKNWCLGKNLRWTYWASMLMLCSILLTVPPDSLPQKFLTSMVSRSKEFESHLLMFGVLFTLGFPTASELTIDPYLAQNNGKARPVMFEFSFEIQERKPITPLELEKYYISLYDVFSKR